MKTELSTHKNSDTASAGTLPVREKQNENKTPSEGSTAAEPASERKGENSVTANKFVSTN